MNERDSALQRQGQDSNESVQGLEIEAMYVL